MALLKIFASALLFACFQRKYVGATNDCQLCISTLDITAYAGYTFTWENVVKVKDSTLCPDPIASGIRNVDNAKDAGVTAHLQVLVYNPYHCYFQFMFGATVSAATCLVSGYNISGDHFTEGHCTAVGTIPAGQSLNVKIANAQAAYPCKLRGNNFLCLSAST